MNKLAMLKKVLGQDVGMKTYAGGTALGLGGVGLGINNLFDEENTAGDAALAGGTYGAGAGLQNAAIKGMMNRTRYARNSPTWDFGGGSGKAAILKALLGAGAGAGLGALLGGDE